MAHGENVEIKALLDIIQQQILIINRQIGVINDLVALLGKPSTPQAKAPVVTKLAARQSR
jgi:hypothetical protein